MNLTLSELKRILEFAEKTDSPAVTLIQGGDYHRSITVQELCGEQSENITDDLEWFRTSEKYRNGYFSGNSIGGYFICSRNKNAQYRIKCKIQGIGIVFEEEDLDE